MRHLPHRPERTRQEEELMSTEAIELRRRHEEYYKRVRAELADEKGRGDRDAYYIEYLENQLCQARRALSAPPAWSQRPSHVPAPHCLP